MKNHTRWVFALALIAMFMGTLSTPAFSADKPRIAVIEFKAKADNQWYHWWRSGGASAAQDVFVTELVKSGKFRVIEREALAALMAEKNPHCRAISTLRLRSKPADYSASSTS